MKAASHIIGFNFLALLAGILCVRFFEVDDEWAYVIPVLILATMNLIAGIADFFWLKKSNAKNFLLSSLVLLIVGSASCVTIHPRKKKKKATPVANTPANTPQQKADTAILIK
jgi:hypothetical protein